MEWVWWLRAGGAAALGILVLTEQLETAEYQALSFEERLGMLVDRESQDRANRRLERNLKAAKLRLSACMEDIDFRHPRGLDQAVVLTLACALTQAAVRAGHTAIYLRAPLR